MKKNQNLTKYLPYIIVILGAAVLIYLFINSTLFSFVSTKPTITYSGNKMLVQNNNVQYEMYPTSREVIKGLVTIKLDEAPTGTKKVLFGMVPASQYSSGTSPNLGVDPDGSNGWSLDFFTKDIQNGEYTVFIVPIGSFNNPIGRIYANVQVQN